MPVRLEVPSLADIPSELAREYRPTTRGTWVLNVDSDALPPEIGGALRRALDHERRQRREAQEEVLRLRKVVEAYRAEVQR